jgi:hypothetical protein
MVSIMQYDLEVYFQHKMQDRKVSYFASDLTSLSNETIPIRRTTKRNCISIFRFCHRLQDAIITLN